MLDRTVLAKVELFAGFDDEQMAAILPHCREITLRRDDVLFHEDDDADELYVVQSGRMAIANRSSEGRESMVALMGPGDAFGEMPLFDDGGRSAQARALEPSALVGVPYAQVRAVLERDPNLLWEVVALLARRLRTVNAALADAMFLDVTGRTAKRLLELAGDVDDFRLPITQEELAGLVGASRERVNKALASFIRLGWIAQTGRRYRILDRTQLARRAT